ncbi:hypothetical protein CH282_26200 [Rhodococcus sp. 06-418-1B]|nr:hypothetical protein CH282_26200 [Rhodococcus sp. 06-418-1B]
MWNISNTVVRWPRLSVDVEQTIIENLGTNEVTERYKIIVVNTGAEAITIANIGLRASNNKMWIDRADELLKGTAAVQFEGPTMPCRLDGFGSQTWIVDEHGLARFRQKTLVVGYVQRYQRSRRSIWWPEHFRTSTKETTSSKVITRQGTALPAATNQ